MILTDSIRHFSSVIHVKSGSDSTTCLRGLAKVFQARPVLGVCLAEIKEMKTRTHFGHRIDMLDAAGEIREHVASVEDYILAKAVWREAIARWPR